MDNNKVNIVMCASGGAKRSFMSDLSLEEAGEICKNYGYEYADENGFVWNLEIEN